MRTKTDCAKNLPILKKKITKKHGTERLKQTDCRVYFCCFAAILFADSIDGIQENAVLCGAPCFALAAKAASC